MNDDNNDDAKESLTLLDRSVSVTILKNVNANNNNDSNTADDAFQQTASAKQGITPEIERLHRLHGTSVILEASKLLQLGASTYATACTLLHRFYHQVSLQDHDVWSVAMASTLLATKVEEEPHTLKILIHVFCHLYRKRILVVSPFMEEEEEQQQSSSSSSSGSSSCWNHESIRYLPTAKTWSTEQKDCAIKKAPLPMKFGPVYQQWHEQVSKMEATVLQQLGFTLYWIPDAHPHKFILYFCRVLDLTTDPKFAQRAWNYCNDSCRLDLCVRFEPEVIASSSILLATRDFGLELPTHPRPWWEIFVGQDKTMELVTAANAILGLCSRRPTEKDEIAQTKQQHDDSLVASRGYLKSLLPDGSFNDPESFLWHHQKEALDILP